MSDTAATPSAPPVVAVLGAGSMARAVLSGLLREEGSTAGIRTTTRSEESAETVRRMPGADGRVEAIATETDADANRRALDGADLVIVAVKPAMVPDLLAEIADAVPEHAVVATVVAGVPARVYEDALPASVAVVRTMPNTPAFVGRGITGVAPGSRVDEARLETVRRAFASSGEVVDVPESELDALSTISGSGPAYVFRMIEALAAAARQKGFDAETADRLAEGTFSGAVALLEDTGSTPTELRAQVTSPKGTTERALAVFDGELDDLVIRATDEALARSRELAEG